MHMIIQPRYRARPTHRSTGQKVLPVLATGEHRNDIILQLRKGGTLYKSCIQSREPAWVSAGCKCTASAARGRFLTRSWQNSKNAAW